MTRDHAENGTSVAYQVEALAVNDAPGYLGPAHQRQRPGTCQDHQRAVLGERVRLGGRQVPHQLIARGHDVHRRTAAAPAHQDLGRLERHAKPRGLGLQDPARGLPERRSLKLGTVDDYPDVHAPDGNSGC